MTTLPKMRKAPVAGGLPLEVRTVALRSRAGSIVEYKNAGRVSMGLAGDYLKLGEGEGAT